MSSRSSEHLLNPKMCHMLCEIPIWLSHFNCNKYTIREELWLIPFYRKEKKKKQKNRNVTKLQQWQNLNISYIWLENLEPKPNSVSIVSFLIFIIYKSIKYTYEYNVVLISNKKRVNPSGRQKYFRIRYLHSFYPTNCNFIK